MSALARAPTRLVDHFEAGLDAPICLTWELTYACNLACVHCLSSSGRRDPRELSTAECRAVIDELEAMQVFYVNIGGGEPTVRRDFWELLGLRDRPPRRGQVLHQRQPHHAADRRAARRRRLRRRADLARRRHRRGQRRDPRPRAPTTRRCGRWVTCARPGMRNFKISVVVTRENVSQLDDVQGDRRPPRRAAADHPAAAVGPRRRRVGRAAPDRRPAARALRLAGRARRGRAHRRLVLPPVGLRPGAAGTEHVRRGPRGVPDRPDRRRLRLPVRDPRRVPRRQRPRAGRVRRGVARVGAVRAAAQRPQSGGACESCTFYDSCRGGCMAAKFFTGLPLDGPDPECALGHGEALLAGRRDGDQRRAAAPSRTTPACARPAAPATRTRSRCWTGR